MLQCTFLAARSDVEAWAWVVDALAAEIGDVPAKERAALIEALMARAGEPARTLLARIAERIAREHEDAGLAPYLPFMFRDA
jgi:hypothetical protein